MKDAINIYQSLARPPKSALRAIQAGRLKGKTDINPQWRYKAMTETFGLVGFGWKYEIQKLWTEQGAKDETLAFAQIAVFVKNDQSWSEPIIGIGGSKLIAIEKGAPVSNDEGYKMAVTDAFSTALKMLGVAADIYLGLWDGSKYKETVEQEQGVSNNAVRESKQSTKLPFTPKGGETTQAEKKEITLLLSSKGADGKPIFSNDEIQAYSDMRKNKTASELIEIIKIDLQKRFGFEEEPEELDIY